MRAVACIDVDSLAQYERDAREGRAEALYNLGLAYSTGQGVGVDLIAAHKWFNLAAVRGVEAAKGWRNQLAAEMQPSQIAQAQKLVTEAQLILAEAAKNRKAIEKLKEKHYETWRHEQAYREAMELDEIGMRLAFESFTEDGE